MLITGKYLQYSGKWCHIPREGVDYGFITLFLVLKYINSTCIPDHPRDEVPLPFVSDIERVVAVVIALEDIHRIPGRKAAVDIRKVVADQEIDNIPVVEDTFVDLEL